MANLKNINDLPVAESAEGLNLIVEDNGCAKRIAANAVGSTGGYIWTLAEGDYTIDRDTLGIIITASYDDVLKVLDEGGSVYVNMLNPTGIYVKSNVVGWCYIPAEMISSTAMFIFFIFNGDFHNNIPSIYTCTCTNGTYVPNS